MKPLHIKLRISHVQIPIECCEIRSEFVRTEEIVTDYLTLSLPPKHFGEAVQKAKLF